MPDTFSFGGKFTQEIPGALAFPKYLQDEIKLPFGKFQVSVSPSISAALRERLGATAWAAGAQEGLNRRGFL